MSGATVEHECSMLLRRLIAPTLVCAALLEMLPAAADTFRCGTILIQPGDDARFVLEKCGEPTLGPSSEAPGFAGNAIAYWNGVTRAARWRYHRGSGQFPVVLVIGDDGRVLAIEFETWRRD